MKNEEKTSGISRLHEEIRETVEFSGYEYAGSELLKEDERSILNVFIDSLGGINVRDCEIVSRLLGKKLDEAGSGLPERYFLQVSSPGVERALLKFSDYERFHGRKAKIKLIDPDCGRKSLTGIIASAKDGRVSFLTEDDGSMDISYENILKANLVFEMPRSDKPTKGDKKRRRQQ